MSAYLENRFDMENTINGPKILIDKNNCNFQLNAPKYKSIQKRVIKHFMGRGDENRLKDVR